MGVIETAKNYGVEVEEYKGIYGLVANTKGQNEVWYKVWVFLSKWQNKQAVPDDKKRPMSIRLGDKDTAIKTLQTLLKQLEAL